MDSKWNLSRVWTVKTIDEIEEIGGLTETSVWRVWNKEGEGAHKPDRVKRKMPREKRQTEWWKRADGGVILLCSHYFSLPDIIVWEMDTTADIIAFIVNFPLYNSLGSAPTKADETLTG